MADAAGIPFQTGYAKRIKTHMNHYKTPPVRELRSMEILSDPEPDDENISFFKTILTNFVELRNKECQKTRSSREAKGDSDLTLDDIMCNFSTAYVPEPVAEQMETNGQLVNDKPILGKGVNGIIVDSGVFEGNPLVTKISIINTGYFIYEIIVNMIIINNILLSGKASRNLVPTYGLFKCPKKVSHKKDYKITACKQGEGSESYFLVQQKIKGKTLRSVISTLTVDRLKNILVQILSTLIILEESEYKLNHNDLHTNNIMIDDSDNAYIIDMGLASFRYGGKFVVQSENQRIYLGDTEPVSLGAIYDIYFLFRDIINICHHLKDTPLIELLESVVKNILSLFAYDAKDAKDGKDAKDTKIIFSTGLKDEHTKPLGDRIYFMFELLSDVESKIKDESVKKRVHDHNIGILKSITTMDIVYAFFSTAYKLDIDNYLKAQGGAGDAASPFKSHKKRKSNKRLHVQRTSRRKASVSRRKASVSRRKASVSRRKASVSRRKASVSRRKASVSRRKASVSRRKASVSRKSKRGSARARRIKISL